MTLRRKPKRYWVELEELVGRPWNEVIESPLTEIDKDTICDSIFPEATYVVLVQQREAETKNETNTSQKVNNNG